VFYLMHGLVGNQQHAVLQQQATTVQQWQPPDQDPLKCNVDASFYGSIGETDWIGGGAFEIIT
ncbi:hypothetical protein A2U01_0031482, partial [Trifolium medium]|nr:hypothetical protein [Trifolium medium]